MAKTDTDKEKSKKFWKATKKTVNSSDFEETRRCLFSSYNTSIQTHAGIIIALTIGLFTVISAFDVFFKSGFWGALTFYALIILILIASGIMFLRIVYWTIWTNIALAIQMERVFDYFNVDCINEAKIKLGKNIEDRNNEIKNYFCKSPDTAMIQYAIKKLIIRSLEKNKFNWYQKLALRLARENFKVYGFHLKAKMYLSKLLRKT
jgi:hypothetical protein